MKRTEYLVIILFVCIFILSCVSLEYKTKSETIGKQLQILKNGYNRVNSELNSYHISERKRADIDLMIPAELPYADRVLYLDLIYKYTEHYNVDPELVCTIIQIESSWRKYAQGKANDTGLMQVIPTTYEYVQKKFPTITGDLRDPVVNLEVGIAYLSILSERFDGEKMKIIVAYNKGHNALIDDEVLQSNLYLIRYMEAYNG